MIVALICGTIVCGCFGSTPTIMIQGLRTLMRRMGIWGMCLRYSYRWMDGDLAWSVPCGCCLLQRLIVDVAISAVRCRIAAIACNEEALPFQPTKQADDNAFEGGKPRLDVAHARRATAPPTPLAAPPNIMAPFHAGPDQC
eukprot:2794566-Prymnesium_polylepis.1